MATIAEATFKAVHDVAKIEIGEGAGAFTINMLPPTKDMFDDMVALMDVIDRVQKPDGQPCELHDLLSVIANVMSNNTSLRQITADELETIGFDVIDVFEFSNVFFQFVAKLAKSKN